MRIPAYTTRFKKDLKRMQARGADVVNIKAVMQNMMEDKQLALKYRDHFLIGNFKDRRECHIEPDWLLIYRLEGSKIIFERTGTHADLLK